MSQEISLGLFIKMWKENNIAGQTETAQNTAIKQIAEAWVNKNRSGIMSAFVKSMRMQNVNHAVYYGAVLLYGGMSKWYVSRRCVISACEDGNDQNVMQYTVSMYKKADKNKTFEDVLLSCIAVCTGKTWWNSEYGKQMMRDMFRIKKLEYVPDKAKSEEEHMKDLKQFLMNGGDEGFMKCRKLCWMLTEKKELLDYEMFLYDIVEIGREKNEAMNDDGLEAVCDLVEKIAPDLAKYNDGNWEDVLCYMICKGANPEPTDLTAIEKYLPLVRRIMDVAETDLMQLDVELPTWAYDNAHASNKGINDFGGDKRFMGTMQGFYNCLLMVKKNGRLSPLDQAELDGIHVPERGLRMFNEKLDDITLKDAEKDEDWITVEDEDIPF